MPLINLVGLSSFSVLDRLPNGSLDYFKSIFDLLFQFFRLDVDLQPLRLHDSSSLRDMIDDLRRLSRSRPSRPAGKGRSRNAQAGRDGDPLRRSSRRERIAGRLAPGLGTGRHVACDTMPHLTSCIALRNPYEAAASHVRRHSMESKMRMIVKTILGAVVAMPVATALPLAVAVSTQASAGHWCSSPSQSQRCQVVYDCVRAGYDRDHCERYSQEWLRTGGRF